MKAKFRFSVMSLLIAISLFGLQTFAQETTGSVAGNVSDPTGAVIPDVAVMVMNQETGQKIKVLTGSDGEYNALELRPGRYSVIFEADGFARKEVRDVVVLLGKTSRIDASLEVGGIEETITVTSTTIIDTSTTMVALSIPSEEFDRLPKTRSYRDLATFQTSVNTGEVEAGLQVNGASAAENNYYIDGVSTNSVIDGSARQDAVLEYVQEVQVKTSGLEAEYGGALGGVISAVTKSGGNGFHGELHYYLYGNRLNSGPTKRLVLDPGDGVTVDYIQDDKQKNDFHEIGGTFSGPIIRDKIWFFSSLAPQWSKSSYTYLFDNGLTADSLQRDTHRMNWFSKLSYDPTDRIRANFTYLYSPQYLTGFLPDYDGMGGNESTLSFENAQGYRTRGFNQPENSWTGHIVFTLSNSALLSVTGGRYYLNYKEIGIPYSKYYRWSTSSEGLDIPLDLQQPQGFETPSAGRVLRDNTTRTYVQTDYSQYLNFVGQHTLKAGIGVQKNVNNVFDAKAGELGRILFYWDTGFQTAENRGLYGYYSVDDAATRGSAGATITHMYIQDSWRIHSRLTLNIGLRTEREVIPAFNVAAAEEALGTQYAIKFGFSDKIAPRVGASFDVFGDGRMKVFGGWGRYYDWTKYEIARGVFGGDLWHTYYRALDTTDIYNIDLNNMPGENLWPGGEFRDWRSPGFELLDPNIKPMSADLLNVGVDYEVRPRTVFSARYTRNKLNRTIEDIGAVDEEGNYSYGYGNPGEGVNKYAFISGNTCVVTIGDGVCSFPMPKPVRVYNAMELSISRRFSGGWIGNISYVYSDLHGNYSGIQSTDEIKPPTLGSGFATNQTFEDTSYRPGGNANLYFDLDQAMWDANGNVGVIGPLPTDRPHVLKIYGSKRFSTGTDVGLYFRVMSGTPVSTQVQTLFHLPVYVEGRGDMGRTPVFSQTDLLLSQDISVGESQKVRFEFNIANLFNQKTATFVFDRYNREETPDSSGINLTNVDLSQGYDWEALVLQSADGIMALDPRYGMEAIFNPGFSARFMVKYIF